MDRKVSQRGLFSRRVLIGCGEEMRSLILRLRRLFFQSSFVSAVCRCCLRFNSRKICHVVAWMDESMSEHSRLRLGFTEISAFWEEYSISAGGNWADGNKSFENMKYVIINHYDFLPSKCCHCNVIYFHGTFQICIKKSNLNIFLNIFFRVPRRIESHTGLEWTEVSFCPLVLSRLQLILYNWTV